MAPEPIILQVSDRQDDGADMPISGMARAGRMGTGEMEYP
jgi:hypothetical protein